MRGIFSKDLTEEQKKKVDAIKKALVGLESQKPWENVRPCFKGTEKRGKELWLDLILLHKEAEKILGERFYVLKRQLFLRRLTQFFAKIEEYRMSELDIVGSYFKPRLYTLEDMDEKMWVEEKSMFQAVLSEDLRTKVKLNSPKDVGFLFNLVSRRVEKFYGVIRQETKKLQATSSS